MNWTTRSINGLVWIGLGTLAAATMGQAPAAAPFITHQLKPNVYWVEGGGGNSTVIVGDKGVIVVDVKVSKAGGQELLDDIAKITPKPVTTVILTHSDGDHINGLAAFPAGLKIIAQESGCVTFDFDGNDTIYGGNYVICTPALADELKRFVIRRE